MEIFTQERIDELIALGFQVTKTTTDSYYLRKDDAHVLVTNYDYDAKESLTSQQKFYVYFKKGNNKKFDSINEDALTDEWLLNEIETL